VKIFSGAPRHPIPAPRRKKDKSDPHSTDQTRSRPANEIEVNPDNTISLLENWSERMLRGITSSPDISIKCPINRPESDRLDPLSRILKIPSCQNEAVIKKKARHGR